MVILKSKRPKKKKVVGIESAIVEVVKNGEVVARIYPAKEGIKVASKKIKNVETTNGREYVPQIPMIIIDFEE